MLTNFSVPPNSGAGPLVKETVSASMKTLEIVGTELLASSPAPSKRRTQIWELNGTLHCSIIGTCLSTADLRRLVVRLRVVGAVTVNDHDLHQLGVTLACRPNGGAKALQKALDRRHQTAINKFAKAKTAEALRVLWDDALQRGEIPGAYWAVLTHPASTDSMVKQVFGDVHMLSHLVGAANRADIRRLCELEQKLVALTNKIERQQRQLRDGFTNRDDTIRRLNHALAQGISERSEGPSRSDGDDHITLEDTIADLHKRLAAETARRERIEHRLAAVTGMLSEAERVGRVRERQYDRLQQELSTAEARMGFLLQTQTEDSLDSLEDTVLYVGGRAHQIPQCRALVERSGGTFLYHDAGVEDNVSLLPGLVSRADIVLFPVDCVSHDAVAVIKRSCYQLGRRYMPLRTSSLTCLVWALRTMRVHNRLSSPADGNLASGEPSEHATTGAARWTSVS
jgi:Uncharacterized protein conserved in bacteria (DUF2325)